MSALEVMNESSTFRIATYNFCQGGKDYDATYRVLAALEPDILFAQELLAPDSYVEKGTRSWHDLGYAKPLWRSVRTQGPKQWGSAIFTRRPAHAVTTVPEKLAGWVVGAVMESPGFAGGVSRPLKAFSIHTPTLATGNYYLWQAQEILEYLADEARDADLVVGGDFNVTISVRRETDQPTQSPLERELIEYMRRAVGLVNCWQTMNPNTQLPRTYHGKENATGHLDGLFMPPAWWRFLATCDVRGRGYGWTEGDHYPVVATFDTNLPRFRERVLPARARTSPSA